MSVYTVDVTTDGLQDLWKRKKPEKSEEPRDEHPHHESHEHHQHEHEALKQQIEDLQASMQKEHNKLYDLVLSCSKKISRQSDQISNLTIEMSNHSKQNKQPETPPERIQNRKREYEPSDTRYFDHAYLKWFRDRIEGMKNDIDFFNGRINATQRHRVDDDDAREAEQFFKENKREFEEMLKDLQSAIQPVISRLRSDKK